MTGRLELARPSPRGDARSRTEVAAVLRWRARWLSRSLPAPLAAAARLFPVLLHASFDHPGLRELAPGVAGLRYRPSWGSLARCFDLPPPHRAQRGTCVVEAVLARKTGERRLELTVLVPEGLRADEYGELEDRMEAARLVLAADGASVATRLLDIGRLAHSHEVCHELAAFGALLAGRVPAPAWAALEEAASEELGGDSLFAMMTSAPTAFAA